MISECRYATLSSFKYWGMSMSQGRKGNEQPRDYAAYLLRLWREKGGGAIRWRASLQDPHSGERVGFANLEELFGFLRRETADLPERNESSSNSKGEGADQA
jgi:hypothetical protein